MSRVKIKNQRETPYFTYRAYDFTPGQKEIFKILNFWHHKKVFIKSSNDLISELRNAREQMINNYSFSASWEEARQLQDLLNDIFDTLVSDEDYYDRVMKGLLDQVQRAGDELQNFTPEELQNMKLNKSMSATVAAYEDYKKEYDKWQKYVNGKNVFTAKQIHEEHPEVKAAFDYYLKEQSSIAKFKGVLFEAFVKGVGDSILEVLKAEASDNIYQVQDYIKKIVETLEKQSADKNKVLKLEGSQKRKIEVKVGDELKTITSDQTVDVVLPSPSQAGKQILNLNLKNYSTSSKAFSLMSAANIVGRINQWENVSKITQNFYESALTYYTQEPRDSFIQEGRKLFLAQGLMGVSRLAENGVLANYFVINRRKAGTADVHNIVVIPINEMLNYIFNNDNIFNEYVSVPFHGYKEYSKSDERNVNDLTTHVYRDIKVSVKLKQSFMSELAKSFEKTGVNFNYHH